MQHNYQPGDRVYINRDCASGRQGAEYQAVPGTVKDTGTAEENGEKVPVVLVERDDGQRGAGPRGLWMCRLQDLGPAELQLGEHVRHYSWPDGVFTVAAVTYDNTGAAHYSLNSHGPDRLWKNPEKVPRGALEVVSPTTPPPPENLPGDIYAAAADSVLRYTGDLTAAGKSRTIPAQPPLNDGARFPSTLPNDSAARKEYPLAAVLFGQFPAAMVAVAHHSYKGNQKHNPGKPLQDNRTLSNDDGDCILRHQLEGDFEGVAWRALRQLQKKLEAEGAPVAPLATFE